MSQNDKKYRLLKESQFILKICFNSQKIYKFVINSNRKYNGSPIKSLCT